MSNEQMLLVKPKFWTQADDPNPDLSESTFGYWAHLTKVHMDNLHTSSKSGRSTGNIVKFLQQTTLHMQTYHAALIDAYTKARRRGLCKFRESHVHTNVNLSVNDLIQWFEDVNVEPHQVMDITVTGQHAKFIVPTFGEHGLMFPDEPNECWWPNDFNIPPNEKWKLSLGAEGDAIIKWTDPANPAAKGWM